MKGATAFPESPPLYCPSYVVPVLLLCIVQVVLLCVLPVLCMLCVPCDSNGTALHSSDAALYDFGAAPCSSGTSTLCSCSSPQY